MGEGRIPQLSVITGWAQESGIVEAAPVSIPLRSVAAFEGVEVLAFFDESPKPTVGVVVHRPRLVTGQATHASFVVHDGDLEAASASCLHTRVALAVERGDGDVASVDVAVETNDGVRAMRVHLSTLWLPGAETPSLSARLGWLGPAGTRMMLQERSSSRTKE
jgi:hypothetical protein